MRGLVSQQNGYAISNGVDQLAGNTSELIFFFVEAQVSLALGATEYLKEFFFDGHFYLPWLWC